MKKDYGEEKIMSDTIKLHYTVTTEDFTRAGEASSDVKRKLKKMGSSPEVVRKVAIAMYEGEINMVIHANGGTIDVEITPEEIIMCLQDTGPGIADIEKAMQAVSAHIRGRYAVPELAAEVNVSPTHLSNLFQRYLGVSPAKYITRIRIEECKALLTDGEMSVGEIASLMGYSSIPHFCKQFRQWTGSSPAEFAREKQA